MSKIDVAKIVVRAKKEGLLKTAKIAKKLGYKKYNVKEGFAGVLKKADRKAFDNTRRKQSEVLGYKLTGKDDIKTEIDDAFALSETFKYKDMIGYTKKIVEKKQNKPKINKVLIKVKKEFGYND